MLVYQLLHALQVGKGGFAHRDRVCWQHGIFVFGVYYPYEFATTKQRANPKQRVSGIERERIRTQAADVLANNFGVENGLLVGKLPKIACVVEHQRAFVCGRSLHAKLMEPNGDREFKACLG